MTKTSINTFLQRMTLVRWGHSSRITVTHRLRAPRTRDIPAERTLRCTLTCSRSPQFRIHCPGDFSAPPVRGLSSIDAISNVTRSRSHRPSLHIDTERTRHLHHRSPLLCEGDSRLYWPASSHYPPLSLQQKHPLTCAIDHPLDSDHPRLHAENRDTVCVAKPIHRCLHESQ